MGHLLEHVAWERVVDFLHDAVAPALTEDGELAIVGPDIYRVIDMWHKNQESWEWVVACLEDCDAQFDLRDARFAADAYSTNATEGWPEARHKWNQYENRLERVVKLALHEDDWHVRAVPIEVSYLGEYPLVAYTQFQCAVIATRR